MVRPVEMNDDARIQANSVTPIAALDGNGVVGAADDGIVAERRDDAGPVSAPETRERAEVHVVVVVVADEDRVDGRQVVEGDARRGVSRRPGKRQRAGALRPDRVEEDIEAIDLDEKTRMTHERDVATTFFQPRRRMVRDGGRQCARPSGGAGAKPPAEHVGQAVVLDLAARIEEARAVEVVADRPLVIGVGSCRRASWQDALNESGETCNKAAARGPEAGHQEAATASRSPRLAAELAGSILARRIAASPLLIVVRGAYTVRTGPCRCGSERIADQSQHITMIGGWPLRRSRRQALPIRPAIIQASPNGTALSGTLTPRVESRAEMKPLRVLFSSDKSERADRFSGAASHCASKRPIWLGEAART